MCVGGHFRRRVFIVHGTDHNQSTRRVHLPDEAATERFGAALANAVQPGLVIWLEGDLGAGKTTLARAMLRALGHTGPVKSPTYALVELYKVSSLYLYHFDFYRLNHPEEFVDAGLDEYFTETAVCLIEWPDKAAGFLPPADLVVRLRNEGAGRALELEAASVAGLQCLNTVSARLPAAAA
ncbi:tRNA (adenosine(37)-N6)-threonylcarbamoyltransferase complex ATPase subunit type 1 TsaE [Rhodocyclus tenuis]|uniref:tRNA threonylcarbamoyladenosine biosynthesis protein TsaE n=1 Tax=Rhodocyclus gracilis TaxID=2929842 RepID=A0ABX0WH88_9RHOO|nr:tRNA (adenosine(37)-N6)-threonylcarbamoyltransferase complex ATPase subunit type 1 TsaE [Rhodocyclus gracilis]NJA89080.1 tRNA (adenosine(37)-N6)-threonylcarbamoyltransferase complex ATPase subunit type 1 TsaE [Rhodocyclus gracilis]